MSHSRRYVLTLLAAAPLGACGFEPLYGPNKAASIARGRIAVDEIGGLMGYELRERLTNRLGASSNPSHHLRIKVNVSSDSLAINAANEITRYSLTGVANFSLNDTERREASNGSVRAFSSYSATASAYATSVAERDARERLAHSLAEQIATRLAVTAEDWAR